MEDGKVPRPPPAPGEVSLIPPAAPRSNEDVESSAPALPRSASPPDLTKTTLGLPHPNSVPGHSLQPEQIITNGNHASSEYRRSAQVADQARTDSPVSGGPSGYWEPRWLEPTGRSPPAATPRHPPPVAPGLSGPGADPALSHPPRPPSTGLTGAAFAAVQAQGFIPSGKQAAWEANLAEVPRKRPRSRHAQHSSSISQTALSTNIPGADQPATFAPAPYANFVSTAIAAPTYPAIAYTRPESVHRPVQRTSAATFPSNGFNEAPRSQDHVQATLHLDGHESVDVDPQYPGQSAHDTAMSASTPQEHSAHRPSRTAQVEDLADSRGSNSDGQRRPAPSTANLTIKKRKRGVPHTLTACEGCKRRKLKCDNDTPCHSCQSRGDPCERGAVADSSIDSSNGPARSTKPARRPHAAGAKPRTIIPNTTGPVRARPTGPTNGFTMGPPPGYYPPPQQSTRARPPTNGFPFPQTQNPSDLIIGKLYRDLDSERQRATDAETALYKKHGEMVAWATAFRQSERVIAKKNAELDEKDAELGELSRDLSEHSKELAKRRVRAKRDNVNNLRQKKNERMLEAVRRHGREVSDTIDEMPIEEQRTQLVTLASNMARVGTEGGANADELSIDFSVSKGHDQIGHHKDDIDDQEDEDKDEQMLQVNGEGTGYDRNARVRPQRAQASEHAPVRPSSFHRANQPVAQLANGGAAGDGDGKGKDDDEVVEVEANGDPLQKSNDAGPYNNDHHLSATSRYHAAAH